MIQDGVEQPFDRLAREGWRHIDTAPIGKQAETWRRNGVLQVHADPQMVEGLTCHGRIVRATYVARGDYEDRWANDAGTVIYTLTHWRPLRR